MAKGGGICVANHTTPLDVLILMCDRCYSLVRTYTTMSKDVASTAQNWLITTQLSVFLGDVAALETCNMIGSLRYVN